MAVAGNQTMVGVGVPVGGGGVGVAVGGGRVGRGAGEIKIASAGRHPQTQPAPCGKMDFRGRMVANDTKIPESG